MVGLGELCTQGCPGRFAPNNGFLHHKWIGLFIFVFISLSWGYFCLICIFTRDFDFIIRNIWKIWRILSYYHGPQEPKLVYPGLVKYTCFDILTSLACRTSSRYKSYTYTYTHIPVHIPKCICKYKSKHALSIRRVKTGTGLLGAKSDKMQLYMDEIDKIKSGKPNT